MKYNYEKPSFLEGAFITDERLYSYQNTKSVDLLSPMSLNSQNAWVLLASVLEFSKIGEYSYVNKLNAILRDARAPVVIKSAILRLLGHIASEDAFILLKYTIKNNIDLAIDAAQGMAYSGYLDLAKNVVSVRKNAPSNEDKALISLILSDFLEKDENSQIDTISSNVSDEEFEKIVVRKIGDIKNEIGKEGAPIWNGELFGVRSFSENMLGALTSGKYNIYEMYGNFLDLRQIFEASTGIDCSGFYSGGRFNQAIAVSIVEGFLDSEFCGQFKEGQRYFFGKETVSV